MKQMPRKKPELINYSYCSQCGQRYHSEDNGYNLCRSDFTAYLEEKLLEVEDLCKLQWKEVKKFNTSEEYWKTLSDAIKAMIIGGKI